MINIEEKHSLKFSKNQDYFFNKPVNTRDTAGMGDGMPRCAKIHYRTHTRITRFGNTAGLPTPILNLRCM
jgi:hypothetical protein